MKIRVNDIKDKWQELAAEEPLGNYPTLVDVQNAGECKFLGPLSVHLSVIREFDHIRVHGEVGASVRLSCSRCLNDYPAEVASVFNIFYTEASELPQDEEVELSEEDTAAIFYSGEEIDFTNEIAEQFLMELPYKPLCREHCQGLCPVCGADLNAASCSCGDQKVSFTFSGLKDYKAKK